MAKSSGADYTGLEMLNGEKMDRILIVNVNWIGDVLFSTPAIRALRECYPKAHIACVVVPRCKEILELSPHLDELIIYDEKAGGGLVAKMRMIASLRARHFDAVFLFHRSLTRTLMVALAGIRERIGDYNPKRGFLLTTKVNLQEAGAHKVEQFLNIVNPVREPCFSNGVKSKCDLPSSNNMELFIGKDDELFAEEFLASRGIKDSDALIVLNPGGNWNLKRWPAENFASLGDKLSELFDARILITGADKDAELAAFIAGLMKHKPIISCGKTTLRQLAALLKRANLVISNDSGPMHIAVSQGAKTIAIFGPTDPKATGPYGDGKYVVIHKKPRAKKCRVPCYNLRCEDNACIKAVSVEDVIREAKILLE
ncbi:MAG: lipopolysaccharide heptosyltransferase II [Candidatus Omnitrophota bacterium]